MNRRSFFSTLGKGAVAAAAVAVLPAADVEAAPPAKLTDIVPPSPTIPVADARHFAVLMGYNGVPIKTMMIDNLPQEIHLDWISHRGRQHVDLSKDKGDSAFPSAGRQQYYSERSEFRLVSKDIYDGKPVEGLARYIMFKGPQPPWPPVKLGF